MRIGLSSKKLLAIDWDARNLRLVLVRRRIDGIDLLKAVSIPVPPDVKLDDAEALGAFVREAMRQARIGAKQVLMSISRDQVVLNTLDLPPTPPEEMAAIVQFQIVKELPFAVEQATLDFAVGSGFDPKEPCSVLVAAVRNEQLEFYRKVAYEAGLSVERIGLRPHANLLAVTAKSPEHKSKTLLLIEVGPLLTEIDIIRDDTLVFSRAASVTLAEYGSGGATRADDNRISPIEVLDHEPDETGRRSVNNLMVEIVRSFEAHRATDPSLNVDRIVVCGASGIEPQLAQMLAARFAANAEMYTPERALDLTAQRAKELRGFSAAVGLAIGQGQNVLQSFDFLHPKKHVSKRTVRLRKLPIAVATILLFVGSAVASYVQFVRPKQQEIAVLDKSIEPKRKAARNIDEFKAQVETLEAWRDSEQYWPEVLATLSENFPPDNEVLVMRLDLESRSRGKSAAREGRMTARLRTASLGKVNELGMKLKELGFLDVKAGKETPIGSQRGAGLYRCDTDVEAVLPPRTKPKTSGEEAGQEEVVEPPPGAKEMTPKPAPVSPLQRPSPRTAPPDVTPASPVETAGSEEESPPAGTTPVPPPEADTETEPAASPSEPDQPETTQPASEEEEMPEAAPASEEEEMPEAAPASEEGDETPDAVPASNPAEGGEP
jgi:Tfp pilus assembly PilM family ATPase